MNGSSPEIVLLSAVREKKLAAEKSATGHAAEPQDATGSWPPSSPTSSLLIFSLRAFEPATCGA